MVKLINIFENKSLLNGALFSLFSFINRGFIFLLLLILANYISPAEYGYLSLFSTVVMVSMYFVAMSTEGYLSVAYFKEKDGLRNAFSSVLVISLFFVVVLSFILFIGGDFWSSKLDLPINILWFTVIICYTTLFANIFLDYLRIKEKLKYYGIFSCSLALINFILSILFVKYFLLGWEGRVYAQTICYIAYGLFALCFFIIKGFYIKPNLAYLKKMIFWGWPVLLSHASGFFRQGCDRYIINNYHSIDDVGIFSFALNLVNIITMIGFGFNQSNSVDIYKTLGNTVISKCDKLRNLSNSRHRFIKLYLFSSFFIAIICSVIVPYLLPHYSSSIKYFLYLVPYGLGVCLYLVYTNYLYFFKKTKIIMYIILGSSIIHLLLSFVFTRYGLEYTSLIYTITQLLVVIGIRWQGLKSINNI